MASMAMATSVAMPVMMEPTQDTLRNLADLIRANSNPDPRIRQPAESKLKEVERVLGFQSCLLSIALNKEADADLRLLVAIVMKNSCERLWTRTIGAGKPGVKEEKQVIKTRLLEWFNEPNKLIATHLGIIVSEMAKCEWPNNWPDLLDTLMTVIHSDNALVVNRGLYTLHHVLRALSQRRIQTFRQTFEKAAAALVRFVASKWKEHMLSLMTQINAAARTPPTAEQWKLMLDTCSIALLNMKCLHRLIVFGIPNPSSNADAADVFAAFVTAIPELLPLRRALPEDNPLHIKLSKLIRCMTRTILDCQKASPINFRLFTSTFLQFFNKLVCEGSFDDKGALTFEKLTVDALSFITGAVDTYLAKDKNKITYTVTAGLRVDEAGFNALKAEVTGVFTPPFVFGLAQSLITRFFTLRQADLELWNDDPERYVADESLVTLSLSVARPHAEHLFRQLLKAFKDGLAPQLFDMVNATLGTASPTSFGASLLQRDAVYTAIGLDIASIKPVFMERKFDLPRVYHEVWTKELNPELGSPELKILRRRIIWLLGEWAAELPMEQFPSLFTNITRALSEPDLVVRMTAAQTMMNIIHTDTFRRVQPQFVAVMNPIINSLFQLIAHTKELDSRHKVMATIQLIVETVGPDIRSAVPTLCDALPKLWTVCASSQNVLRNQILATLTGLVNSLAHDSARLHSDVLVPILRYVTDSTIDERLYLQADGLELWLAVLQNAPAYTPELSSLFNHWVVLCSNSVESMDMTPGILDSYLILGQGTFLQQHAKSVVDVMNSYPRRLKTVDVSEVDNSMPRVCAVLETIAQLFPKDFLAMFRPFLEFMLQELLQAQRKLAALSEENKRIEEANRIQKRNDAPKTDATIPAWDILNGYLHVIARLLYQSGDGMVSLLSDLTRPNPPFELLASIIDIWSEAFDAITLPYKKKLGVLAMCTLIPTTQPILLQRVAGIVNHCTSVMADFETKGLKHLEYEPITAPDGQAIEIHRVSSLTMSDPSTAAYVSREVVASLKKCQAMNSADMWNNVHSSIDPAVWHEITHGVPPSAD